MVNFPENVYFLCSTPHTAILTRFNFPAVNNPIDMIQKVQAIIIFKQPSVQSKTIIWYIYNNIMKN